MTPGTPNPRGRADRRAASVHRAARRRSVRRQRLLAAAVLAIVAGMAALIILQQGGQTRVPADATGSPAPSRSPSRSFGVGIRVLQLINHSRTVQLPTGPAPRSLLTYVRYPSLAVGSRVDVPDAAAPRSQGPFPLVVFGHGFDVTPALYARLLQAWTSAGYVVAAPVFPLENANAPGGPDESDLSNQPGDMQLVISELLALSAAPSGPLAGLIDPTRIAVAGQSDGGDTALAVAFNSNFRDPRVKAAVILSGAELPGVEGFAFAPGEPPLLATQGTADTINPPSATNTFFAAASTQKYLLSIVGAKHLPPYSHQEPQLAIVQRVTISFLDAYLKRQPDALVKLRADGNVAGLATLAADP